MTPIKNMLNLLYEPLSLSLPFESIFNLFPNLLLIFSISIFNFY